MCQLLDIEKTRTTPYNPKSDGMVERFNKTLATMLSSFVNDNHTNWDSLIPYVMMAYRSAVHETTAYTPNMLMFGRETSTPLDIQYEMPPAIKPIPTKQWVWELRETLEQAHTKVREITGESMKRQKKVRDIKTSFETFKPGDLVYAYFPVKKIHCSSKLTSFWRGPFKVHQKLSEVLYKVDCGRANTIQVIHCDRLKKARSQILTGETEAESHTPETEEEITDEQENNQHEEIETTGQRKRHKPAWHYDYVF